MKYPYAFLIFALAFLLQTTLLHHLSVFGVSPNLLLCLVVVFAFLYEKPYGPVMGVIFGLIRDLSFGIYVGATSISFLLAALSVMLLKQYLNHEQLLPAFFAALLGTAVNSLAFWSIYKLLGVTCTWFYILKLQTGLFLCNTILILILDRILVRRVVKHRRDRLYKGTFREAKGFRF